MVSKPELPIVHAMCTLKIVDSGPELEAAPLGKSFLKLIFPDGAEYCITTNLGEMIGGAATGARKRREDREKLQ